MSSISLIFLCFEEINLWHKKVVWKRCCRSWWSQNKVFSYPLSLRFVLVINRCANVFILEQNSYYSRGFWNFNSFFRRHKWSGTLLMNNSNLTSFFGVNFYLWNIDVIINSKVLRARKVDSFSRVQQKLNKPMCQLF